MSRVTRIAFDALDMRSARVKIVEAFIAAALERAAFYTLSGSVFS